MNEEAAWVLSRSEVLFRNPHVEVRDETVVIPGENHPRHWTVVGRKKAIVVAPVTEQGHFVLIHQARIPVRRWLWEFPAGQVDETKTPDLRLLQQTALRELAEEAGYELVSDNGLIYLGHYFPSQGFTDEENHLFLANPVRKNAFRFQLYLSMALRRSATTKNSTFTELRDMIARSTIQDANTLALFARLMARGLV